jgi:dienelactone hydrolase
LFLATAACSVGAEPAKLPESTPWDVKALQNAPKFAWLDTDGPVHSLKYEGEAFEKKPTQVFAYYASPVTLGKKSKNKTFPGIVLVHGGGGMAFSKWAELWANRGYAAIAMDLAGRDGDRKRLPNGGPDQSAEAKFGAIDGPITDQWSYHAVANVIRTHSLLLSFDEVDAKRTAITGISWGGYLTCIVAGLDQRFQVAMPVYGCGFLKENSAWVTSQFEKMTPKQSKRWNDLWDPSRYIGSATMPVVFLNGTNDFAYPMDSYAKTCTLVQGEKNYSIQLRMRHGHIFGFPEFFLAIDQYLKDGTPLPVIKRPQIKGGMVTTTVKTSTKLVTARLHYTTGPHRENKARSWTTQPLTVEGNTIRGVAPPQDATVWYVDVRDERKALVSSQVMLVK